MRTKLVVGGILLSITGAANAETCFSTLPNSVTNSSSTGYWVVPSNVPTANTEGVALNYCRTTYCDVHVPMASNPGIPESTLATPFATTVMQCATVRASSKVSTSLAASNDNNWCCLTQATKTAIQTGGSSSGGGTETTTPQTYPILICPASMGQYNCNEFCTKTATPIVKASILVNTKTYGNAVSTTPAELKDRWFCTTLEGGQEIGRNICPDNQLAFGNKSYTVADISSTTIAGTQVNTTSITTKATPTYPVCVCKPEWYGTFANSKTANYSNCTECPCVTSIDGATLSKEVCGQTYNLNNSQELSQLAQAVMQGSVTSVSISACKISCDGSSCKAKDNTGTWYYTNECAY